MLFKVVEARGPHPPVGRQPLVEHPERLRPYSVQATLRVGAHLDQAGLAQDAQVLGDGRLAQIEPLYQIAHRRFGRLQEIEDAPAVRLCEDLERGHGQ